jgi:hypothetical protein
MWLTTYAEVTMFETTSTGYVATDETVKWWQQRDICPSCTEIVEPYEVRADGAKLYRHDCDENVEWGAYSPADTAELEGA